ncbi:hypothetical protein [Polaromonas sp. YR568]|uniref:hypothetical protein n=1 Tax=Polaromonas sp. YR568 TaxID=1855301 RepID=UPI00313777E4
MELNDMRISSPKVEHKVPRLPVLFAANYRLTAGADPESALNAGKKADKKKPHTR